MTADPRLERALPRILADLGAGATPDYVDSLLARTAATRQRPGWIFPERWLPMSVVTSRVATAPPIRWRTIAVLALLIVAVIAAAILVGSSRQRDLPAPFGVARNGEIATAIEGDIVLVDPVTGRVTPIVTSPDHESGPAFSPDGTKVAFLRASYPAGTFAQDIVVVDADGSDPIVITREPIVGGPEGVQWAPDSATLLVDTPDRTLWLFDATVAAPPRVLSPDANNTYLLPFQPPDGDAVLFIRSTAQGRQIVLHDLESGRETVVLEGAPDAGASWSPDGSQIVYDGPTVDDPEQVRLHIAAADGSGHRQLSTTPGRWVETDVRWSPDGSRIAFNRWQHIGSEWLVRPVGIISVADGTLTEVGPVPPSSGYHLAWSPDGRSLIALPGDVPGHPIVIDADRGTWRELAPTVTPEFLTQSWQRLAP